MEIVRKKLRIYLISFLFGFFSFNNAKANDCRGFYLDANMGYLTTDWQKSGLFPYIQVPNFTLAFNNFEQSKGGFVYGMDLGYLINRYMGFEIGVYSLPTVNAQFTINTTPNILIRGWDTINNWMADTAAKIIIPLPCIRNLDVFAKFGGAYRNVQFRGRDQQNNNVDLNGLSFMGGAGLQYQISSLLSIQGQWLYLDSYTHVSQNVSITIPSANLFMASLGINLHNL